MARPPLRLLLVLPLLAGCSAGSLLRDAAPSPTATASPTPTASASAPASPSAAAAHPDRARREVRAAVLALLGERTGRASSTLLVGSLQIRDLVYYDVFRGFTIERELLEDGEVPMALDAVAIGDHLWYQITARKGTSCYIHATVDQLPGIATVGHASVQPAPGTATVAHTTVPVRRPYPHATVSLLSRVRGEGVEPWPLRSMYSGSVRLVDVVGLLGGETVQRLAIDPRSKVRVPAELRVSEGLLAAIKVKGPDFVDGLVEAGVDDPDVTEAGGLTQFLVSFTQAGTPVTLSPPPAAETIELVGPDFEGRMADCVRKHR